MDKWESDQYSLVEPNSPDSSDEKVDPTVEDGAKPVPPPKPSKKIDNSYNVTSLLPTSSPVTVSMKAIEFLLRSSQELLFRNHQPQFLWKVFDEVATLGSPLRYAMVQRGHLRALVHLYLQEDSIYYIGDKTPTSPSSRSKAYLAFLGGTGPLLSAISQLVCTFSFPRNAPHAYPSPYGSNEDILSDEDQKALLHGRAMLRFIGDRYNPEAVSRFCCHLGWENISTSEKILHAVCDGKSPLFFTYMSAINRDNNDQFPPYASFLEKFLLMQDHYEAERVSIGLTRLIKVLKSNLKYPLVSTSTVNCIANLSKKSAHVRSFLLAHFSDLIALLITREVEGSGKE